MCTDTYYIKAKTYNKHELSMKTVHFSDKKQASNVRKNWSDENTNERDMNGYFPADVMRWMKGNSYGFG